MSVSAVIDGEAFRVNEGMGPEVSGMRLMRLGDAVPQAPWDLPLFPLLPQGEQAGRASRPTRPPAVCKAPVGARVASQRCPTLRGANGFRVPLAAVSRFHFLGGL